MASIWNRERDGRWFGGVSWHLGYRVTRIPRYRSSSSLHTTIYTIPSNSPKKLVREDLLPSFAVPRHKRPTCPSFVSIWRSVASFAWRIGCPSCETRPGVAFSLSLSDLAFGVQAHLSFAFGSGLQVVKEGEGGGATEARTVNQPFALPALIYAPRTFPPRGPISVLIIIPSLSHGHWRGAILISPNPEMTKWNDGWLEGQ